MSAVKSWVWFVALGAALLGGLLFAVNVSNKSHFNAGVAHQKAEYAKAENDQIKQATAKIEADAKAYQETLERLENEKQNLVAANRGLINSSISLRETIAKYTNVSRETIAEAGKCDTSQAETLGLLFAESIGEYERMAKEADRDLTLLHEAKAFIDAK